MYDPATGGNVSVSQVLGTPGVTYATKREAKAAREQARTMLGQAAADKVTVDQWRTRWLTDPLFARRKQSTMRHNAERTHAFAERYGHLALDAVNDFVVAQWLAGGHRNSTVPALRAMFNDARSAKAGRLITINPFADLGIERTRGNKDRQPPTQPQVENLVAIAQDLTPPSFAGYLEFACCTAARPSELDAMQWDQIRWDDGEVDITIQWSSKIRAFDTPKYGPYTIALVGRARDVLLRMKQQAGDSPFVFTTLRGTHYTPSSRTHHWNRVRAAAGLGNTTFYLATRHYFGWYATNVLDLPAAIVAEQLGHKDGGRLVEQLYGHPDRSRRRRQLRDAYDQAGQVRQLRAVKKETG